MKLISTPEVKFPEDFEVYDPKVTNNFDVSRSGLTGSQTIEYLSIPRHAGNFTIPPVEFTYFDLKTNSYKTLKTEAYNINVAKGKGKCRSGNCRLYEQGKCKGIGPRYPIYKVGRYEAYAKG